MTLCDDCVIAQADRLHAIFWSHRPCCIARALASIPRRQRKFAAVAIRDARPDEWAAIRARLVALLGDDGRTSMGGSHAVAPSRSRAVVESVAGIE